MTTRNTLEDDVVALLDIITPARLAEMESAQRNQFKLIPFNRFDQPVRVLLAIPLGRIARRHGNGHARLIGSDETEALADVGAAIDLTARAAQGKP